MRFAKLWSSRLKSSSNSPTASEQPRRHVDGRDREREADDEREGRAHGEPGVALDQRDAEPGERAELRADDHRADDQDRASPGRCRPPPAAPARTMKTRKTAESSTCSLVRASTSSQTTASDGSALGVRIAALGVRGDLGVDLDAARSSRPGRGRGRAGRRSRRSRPRARRRRGSGRRPGAAPSAGRWTMLQTASEPSSSLEGRRGPSAPARRSAGGSRAEPTAGAGPCPAPAARSASRRTRPGRRAPCPGSPRTGRRSRARRRACTPPSGRRRSPRRAAGARCGTSTCGPSARACGRGGRATSGRLIARSRSSTSPSPVTSSAAPSPFASVPVVGTMYGFHGATMSAYSRPRRARRSWSRTRTSARSARGSPDTVQS